MSDRARITLALAGCWMFVLAVLAGTTFLVGADLANDERASIEPIVSEHMLAALIIATVLCAPGGLVVQALFKRHVVAARRLSEDARVMLKANPEHRAPLRGSAELARLARDLNDFATARAVLQHDVETRI